MGIKESWVNSYDKWFCLEDGNYTIRAHSIIKQTSPIELKINGTQTAYAHAPNWTDDNPHANGYFNINHYFRRGDYMQMTGQRHGGVYSHFTILKNKR